MAANDSMSVGFASKPEPVNIADLPGFGPSRKGGEYDLKKYKVRYFKADMDNPEDVSTLESIETRALLGEDIVLMSKEKFTFMQQFFMLLCYLEYTK